MSTRAKPLSGLSRRVAAASASVANVALAKSAYHRQKISSNRINQTKRSDYRHRHRRQARLHRHRALILARRTRAIISRQYTEMREARRRRQKVISSSAHLIDSGLIVAMETRIIVCGAPKRVNAVSAKSAQYASYSLASFLGIINTTGPIMAPGIIRNARLIEASNLGINSRARWVADTAPEASP